LDKFIRLRSVSLVVLMAEAGPAPSKSGG
jgi:hypothetical protein